MLQGNILITGGAGFLGRGILAKAVKESWPAKFTIFSRDEQKQDACRQKFPQAAYVLGDIRDIDRLSAIMANQDIVIHAAALKYIPEAESNVNECIGVNVGGTQSVISAARYSRVQTVVFISTDKAVEPLNTYGLTKALGERLMLEASRDFPEREFLTVRYGNVIGSTGSVVPLFKRMAKETGSITVTDGSMTRFWISIEEAVDLIDDAVLMCPSGEIMIPPARAMSLTELASAVAPNAEIQEIGLRPGEKMHEKLLTKAESVRAHRTLGSDSDYTYFAQGLLHPYANAKEFEIVSHSPAVWLTPIEFASLAEQAAAI